MCPAPSLDHWLPYRKPLAAPRLRLVAIPFAGGGASAFRLWPELLPSDVELCAVQLPGRETRFKELAFVRMRELVAELAAALAPLTDRPIALFGHSLGALVAFELCREWRRTGTATPILLCAAGLAAPHRPDRAPPLHALPDPEFRSELRRLNGTPAGVLDNDELLQAFLPTLRADFALAETYEYADEQPLSVPIAALGGIRDPRANFDDLDAWRIHTLGSFSLRVFSGDHFFLQSNREELLSYLSDKLHAWPPAIEPCEIAADEVHVWRIDLDENVKRLHRLERSLASDERARADRFQIPLARERFMVGRGVLREVLGRYLGCEPAATPLCYNSLGKPAIVPTSNPAHVQFNLAHSDRWALIAVTRSRAVGIDIERCRDDVECLELADRYFSSSEASALRALPADAQRAAFFAGWTRKEAYLKAHGVGLSLPLDQFTVSLDALPRLLSSEHDSSQQTEWELHSLEPAPDFAAALAVRGRGLKIRCLSWAAED